MLCQTYRARRVQDGPGFRAKLASRTAAALIAIQGNVHSIAVACRYVFTQPVFAQPMPLSDSGAPQSLHQNGGGFGCDGFGPNCYFLTGRAEPMLGHSQPQ
jgi:hypothetical protein